MPIGIPILFTRSPDRNVSPGPSDPRAVRRVAAGGDGPKMRQKKARKTKTEKANTTPVLAGDGIVIVDGDFRPIALDRGAEGILADLHGHCRPDDNALPPSILTLLHAPTDMQADGAPVQIATGNREYSCRTILIQPQTASVTQPLLALYLKREISVADAVHQLSLEYHLTDREEETLIGLSMGLTSKELAARMNISPNTVKAFLRLIMLKMGTTTRAGVVGKLLDQNSRLSSAASEGPR